MPITHHLFKRERAPSGAAGGRARVLTLAIGIAMLLLGVERTFGADKAPREHELKAAFLYNFTKFIEWPGHSFVEPNAPFVIGVAGETPCAAELEHIARDRKVNGRTLVIRQLRSPEVKADVHLLFVPASEDARAEKWLAAMGKSPVLTIGESESFTKRGGAIGLLLEGEKVRFEINIGVAETARLKVSAQLQKLAKTVRRK